MTTHLHRIEYSDGMICPDFSTVHEMPKAYLFAQRTINEYPANLGSADAEYIVTAEDGMDYVVKTTKKIFGVPASEWICQNLADACGIPTPQFSQIELRNGDLGFGSQWDESAIKDQATRNQIVLAVPGLPILADMFSAIYVLDLFSFNVDRHLGNYFFVRTNLGVGVKAYDFSRAFYSLGWPIPAPPLPSNCHTVACYRSLKVGYPLSPPIAAETLRRIAAVPQATVQSWLDEMPTSWMSDAQKAETVKWWTTELPQRLANILLGLKNGTLL